MVWEHKCVSSSIAEEDIAKIHKELCIALVPHKIAFTKWDGEILYYSLSHPDITYDQEGK